MLKASRLELADLINTATGNQSQHILHPPRPWDTSGNRFGDPEKASKQLNFTAKRSLREGIEITSSWMNENLAFIEKCMSKHHEFL